jgi:hypothetical protein
VLLIMELPELLFGAAMVSTPMQAIAMADFLTCHVHDFPANCRMSPVLDSASCRNGGSVTFSN